MSKGLAHDVRHEIATALHDIAALAQRDAATLLRAATKIWADDKTVRSIGTLRTYVKNNIFEVEAVRELIALAETGMDPKHLGQLRRAEAERSESQASREQTQEVRAWIEQATPQQLEFMRDHVGNLMRARDNSMYQIPIPRRGRAMVKSRSNVVTGPWGGEARS